MVQALNNISVFHLDGLPWPGGGDVHFSRCMRLEALSYFFSDWTKKHPRLTFGKLTQTQLSD